MAAKNPDFIDVVKRNDRGLEVVRKALAYHHHSPTVDSFSIGPTTWEDGSASVAANWSPGGANAGIVSLSDGTDGSTDPASFITINLSGPGDRGVIVSVRFSATDTTPPTGNTTVNALNSYSGGPGEVVAPWNTGDVESATASAHDVVVMPLGAPLSVRFETPYHTPDTQVKAYVSVAMI